MALSFRNYASKIWFCSIFFTVIIPCSQVDALQKFIDIQWDAQTGSLNPVIASPGDVLGEFTNQKRQ